MVRGIKPEYPEAIALAREWRTLLKPLEAALGSKQMARTDRMYAEMDQWQTKERRAPFTAEVFAFVGAATRAANDEGALAQ